MCAEFVGPLLSEIGMARDLKKPSWSRGGNRMMNTGEGLSRDHTLCRVLESVVEGSVYIQRAMRSY